MEILRMLGRGPGFVLVGLAIVAGLVALAYHEKDVAALTGPLGAFVAAFYGAGFAKAAVDVYGKVKNGGKK